MTAIMLLATVFTTILVVTLVTDRLPIPREAVYLLIGIGLSQILAVPDIAILAGAGGAFLIFFTTAHLETAAISDVMPTAAVAVSAQVVLFVIAAVAGLVGGWGTIDALFLGLVCSTSSSMLGVARVRDQVDRRLLHGRLTEAVNTGQDIATVMLTAALPFWPRPVTAVVAALACVGVLFAIRVQNAARRVYTWLGRDEATTLILGVAVLWTGITAAQAHPYGMLLGTVVAGFIIAGHEANWVLRETLSPVTDFFAALFFVGLGLLAGVPTLPALGIMAGLVLAIAVVRPVLILLGLREQRIDLYTAFLTAFQLDQVSEIVLLLGLLLYVDGAITATVFQAVVLTATITFVTAAFTTRNAPHLYLLAHDVLGRERERIDRDGHVIIAGYGGWGRMAADTLNDPVIIENDPEKVDHARDDGYTALLGDIRDHHTWERAALHDATHVVLTIPSDTVGTWLVEHGAADGLIAVTESATAATALREHGAAYARDEAGLVSRALRDALDAAMTDLQSRRPVHDDEHPEHE